MEKLGTTKSDETGIYYVLELPTVYPREQMFPGDSRNLEQKLVKAGLDREREIKHGIPGLWEIEFVVKTQR